jgi:hypothetical protein
MTREVIAAGDQQLAAAIEDMDTDAGRFWSEEDDSAD